MTLGLRITAYDSVDDNGNVIGSPIDAFWFTSESATISHARTPISSVLPGTDPVLIDLGQWKVDIKFEGTCHKDYMLQRTQDGDRICRRNDIEMLGSNLRYSITNNVYDFSGTDVNWYDKFIIFEDYSSKDTAVDATNPYKYAVKSGGVMVRTDSNTDFVSYSVQLLGYRIV